MSLVDVAIVIFMIITMLGGISQGFFRSVCALAGLVLGVAMAAWYYRTIANVFLPIVHIEPVANAIGFVLIALFVMGLAALAGKIMAKTVHGMGLGCLDKLAGAAFGLLQGALLVTVAILVTVAFFPGAHWLTQARLPRFFFGACHLSTQMSPSDLAERVREGLRVLEKGSPRWLHRGAI